MPGGGIGVYWLCVAFWRPFRRECIGLVTMALLYLVAALYAFSGLPIALLDCATSREVMQGNAVNKR